MEENKRSQLVVMEEKANKRSQISFPYTISVIWQDDNVIMWQEDKMKIWPDSGLLKTNQLIVYILPTQGIFYIVIEKMGLIDKT